MSIFGLKPMSNFKTLGRSLIVGIAAAGLLTGCGDEEELVPNPLPVIKETKVKYDEVWSINFGAGNKSPYVTITPASGYDKIFIADVAGTVKALDPNNGKSLWSTSVNERISAGVSVANQMVVVGTREGQVVALDVESGEQKWIAQVTSEIISSPAIGDGFVVVNTVDGNVVALDAESGERKWFYDRNVPALTLRGTSAPVIAHGAAIAGFANGKVGVFILQTGQLAWEKQITTPSGKSDLERLVDVDAQPIVFGSNLYASSFNGNLAALDLRSGEPVWSRELSAYKDMNIDNQSLLVTQDNGHVSSLNRNNGVLMWTQKALFMRQVTSPVVYRQHILVGDMGGYIHMIDKSDGTLIGQLNVNEALNFSDCYDSQEYCQFHNHEEYGIASSPLVVDDKVIVQTRNGQLIAYKQREES